jgi:putative Holliday junction resolvase
MANPPAPRPRGLTIAAPAEFAELIGQGRALLGLDLGTRTIGIAISDVTRLVASPLETIRRTRFSTDAAALLRLAEADAIAGFVLGLPINLDGSEGPRVQATRAFARNLNGLSPLPILLWDERLTTAQAERTLLEADASRRRRTEVIDKLAAAIILQGALDRLRRLDATTAR